MRLAISHRRLENWWIAVFIIVSLSWLWAPQLNHVLSDRTTLISQYEASSQPYSWLFRLADVAGASLLFVALFTLGNIRKLGRVGAVLVVIAGCMLLDPVFSTTCKMIGDTCHEYSSAFFILHAFESVVGAFALFGLSVYDYWLRKRLISLGFVIFQILYGGLFVSQLSTQNNFNTLSQFVYQTVIIVWLAWFVRENLFKPPTKLQANPSKIRQFFAAWALLNGVLAILVSLADINIFGRVRGLYFAGNTAWLAQHTVIVGLVMIYLSRHLARGEQRARQIFMIIAGLEVFKYSAVTPSAGLLALYLITFCALFVSKSSFYRGNINLTWAIRAKDAIYMLTTLLLSSALVLWVLELNEDRAKIAGFSINHFIDYTVRPFPTKHHLQSALLAHTFSAFLLGGVTLILWALFRPNSIRLPSIGFSPWIKDLLSMRSSSSEDFFKLWPPDKNYFALDNQTGFIAFKQVGSVVFGLADPIAKNHSLQKRLLIEFVGISRSRRLHVCFLSVEQKQLKLYQLPGLNELQIGASALVDIEKFLNQTARDKWWRWQKNRATKLGYEYHVSLPPHSPDFLRQLREVSDSWLSSGRQERSFVLGYFDEGYLEQCLVHYLTDNQGQVAAFVNQIPTYKQPTASIDLMRHHTEANNAMPYLLFKTIENVGSSGRFSHFDLGFAPFAQTKGPITVISRLLGAGRFSYEGVKQFKNKFDPDWQPIYLVYDGDLADLSMIALNLEKAMELKR